MVSKKDIVIDVLTSFKVKISLLERISICDNQYTFHLNMDIYCS